MITPTMTPSTSLAPTAPPPSPALLDLIFPRAAPTLNVARFSCAYAEGTLLVLLLCWSPSNLLAYLAPFAMLTWFFLRTRSRTVLRNSLWWIGGWLLIIVSYGVWWQGYAWGSALLTLLTYSSFLPLLAIPTRGLDGQWIMATLRRPLVILLLAQASLGLVQAVYGYTQTGSFDGSNGDRVEGTIHPWLAAELSFSNPMFAVNMTFLLLALMPDFLQRRRHLVPIALGALALIAASVVHVMLFTALAIGCAVLVYLPVLLRRKSGYILLGFIFASGILATTLLSRNFSQLSGFATSLPEGGTPRSTLVREILPRMVNDYPLMPIIGLGPGQFSSRAGLIGTGRYFGRFNDPRPLPLLKPQMSEPFARHFLDLWSFTAGRTYYGSTHKPFSSWISIYAEFGLVAWLLIAAFLAHLLWRIRRRARVTRQPILAITLSIGVLIIFLLGFQENYWEVPQAIFPGLLILKLMLSQLTYPVDNTGQAAHISHAQTSL